MSLIGSLDEVKLADVLRLFSAGKKTGRLTISGEEVQGVLRFQKGTVVHAIAGRLHGEEAVIDLFGWKEGQLTFVPEERPVTPNVSRGTDQLILDGVRLGEQVHRMHNLIDSDRVLFQMGTGPADEAVHVSLGGADWRVLRLVDGVRDVREIVEFAKVSRAEVVRILFESVEKGLLEKVETAVSLVVTSQGLFGRDAAELDDRVEQDWRRLVRFAGGILRVEVRSGAGKTATLPVAFRAGLVRGIHLPRAALADLAVRDGDEVSVRPVA